MTSRKGYSIFHETMADMPWTAVEKAAQDGAAIIFPTAGLTEHGPHMPCGVDLYETYMWSRLIKQELEKKDVSAVLAPPFYWAINTRTVKNWPGSFNIKPEIVKGVFLGALESLKQWGFEHVFFVSWHSENEKTIMEACKEARKDIGIKASFLLPEFRAYRPDYKLTGKEEHVIIMPSSETNEPPSKYVNLHAGSGEVSYMTAYFPDLVDTDLAKTLKPTNLTRPEFMEMVRTPGAMKKRCPGGYIGDPAHYDTEDGRASFEDDARRAAITVESVIKGTYKPPESFKPYKPSE